MPGPSPDANVVLIGFPGAGKSTIGLSLARQTRRRFLDTDVLLQAQHGQTLADLHQERHPLYERWAQRTVDCRGKAADEVVAAILAGL